MSLGRTLLLAVSVAAMPLLSVGRVEGTVDMQVQAKRLGFNVVNCLYCHATPHAIEKMKDKAKALAIADGNCLACHGANIPATLNDRGHWLVAEKRRRAAKECDMAWLRDYKEATPSPAAPRHTRP